MPSYKEKAKNSRDLHSNFSNLHDRFDEMEARALVDGAVLREIRSRIQQLSLAAESSTNAERLAHSANQLKLNFGEIEHLVGVTPAVTLPPGEYTPEAVLDNLNQRVTDLLAHLKTSRNASDEIIREILGYPVVSKVANGKIRVGSDPTKTIHVPKEVFPEHRDVMKGPAVGHEQRPNPLSTPSAKNDKHHGRADSVVSKPSEVVKPPSPVPSTKVQGSQPVSMKQDSVRPGSADSSRKPLPTSLQIGHKTTQSVGGQPAEQKGIFSNMLGGPKKADPSARH